METTETVTPNKKRQVKFTFEGLKATVNVTGSDNVKEFDIEPLSDEIKLQLLQYGFKQKLSDYRAGDKLREDEKLEAIEECYGMLASGEFRQKGAEREKVSFEDRLEAWQELSDEQKQAVKPIIGEAMFTKLEKASK